MNSLNRSESQGMRLVELSTTQSMRNKERRPRVILILTATKKRDERAKRERSGMRELGERSKKRNVGFSNKI